MLEQLRIVSDVLVEHASTTWSDTLTTLGNFAASLGEAVASGPYFKVMLVNLLPDQILQPFIDAAFKKRGIDPEKFWRDAGLPAFRFPDPNGHAVPQRRAGAGAAAPGGHPGAPRARGARGLAVLVHAAARRAATTRQPAAVRRSDDRSVRRPSARTRPARRGRPRTRTRTVPGSRRVCRAAAIPGQMPPDMPGAPVPLPPAPPGARTVPVGTAASAAGLHAGHRAAAACADGSAAATRTGSRRRPGGYPAAARQPAVPPARIVGGADRCRRSSTSET